MVAFTERLRDEEGAISAILNCPRAVQELLTIDHIANEKSKQYSMARTLTDPELLQRLLHQLKFDDMAMEKILGSLAAKRINSMKYLSREAQESGIDHILSDEDLRQNLVFKMKYDDLENIDSSPRKRRKYVHNILQDDTNLQQREGKST
jgi:hypothetical protein